MAMTDEAEEDNLPRGMEDWEIRFKFLLTGTDIERNLRQFFTDFSSYGGGKWLRELWLICWFLWLF